MAYTLGLDFGTESVRAVLVDVANGFILSTSACAYAHGVIDRTLPNSDVLLPPEYALQDPTDWCDSLRRVVGDVLRESGVSPDKVIGIGIDFTACTILPVTRNGEPLCEFDAFRSHPHAWPKLWKHHAAQDQADRITRLALSRNEQWIGRYGGIVSSEWALPKALQILEEDRMVFDAAAYIIEGGDWIVLQLTGALTRNTCAAGYKGLWHKTDGWVNQEFLDALDGRLATLFTEQCAGPLVPPGTRAGGLTEEWSSALGLRPGTPVGGAMIDAHAACIGDGISFPGTMYMIMGTSTCHMLMASNEVPVSGISGVVEDGIVAGLFGYEAGQASVGDALAWSAHTVLTPEVIEEARHRGVSHHDILTERAARIAPGESGLLALDWLNGCRTPLVDAELTGMILGVTLATTPEEMYRAVIEATAFGTRMIIETFERQGVPVQLLVAGGGLTRNALVMQIYADVCGREIAVAGGTHASAMGAAILGAVAVGEQEGGFANIASACAVMAPRAGKTYAPNAAHVTMYNQLFKEYTTMVEYFGNGTTMKKLKAVRAQSLSQRDPYGVFNIDIQH